ncbi:MAG: glycosyl transferase [Pseudohongiella sp.]|nr:MAG: glycosyl transferase [Pseudohongiella sp.]
MPTELPLNISVSIVCFDSSEIELRNLITSLVDAVPALKQSFPEVTLSVFLIDNSVKNCLSLSLFNDLEERMLDRSIDLRLIQGHGNVGFGRGHNLVLNKLTSSYHLILNPDVQLDADCLLQGIAHFEQHENIVLESPSATSADGSKQYLCKRYPSVLTFLVRGFFPKPWRSLFGNRLAKYEMHDLSEAEPSNNIPIVSGCFMFCRTAALKSMRGFDEAYFLYFEDFDLSLRMGAVGEIAYVPSMKIRHTGGHAARKGIAHLRMFARSGIRFFSTHGWRFFRQAG